MAENIEIGSITVGIRPDIEELGKGLRVARMKMRKFGAELQGVGKQIGKGFLAVASGLVIKRLADGFSKLGRSILGPIAKSIKIMAAFEKTIADIATLMDDTSSIDGLRTAILDLSVEFGKAANDMSGALYDIVSAGFAAADATKVLKVAAMASVAGLTSTKTAADALTTVLNAYGLGAENAERVSDLLFQTVKNGKITFNQLAPAIGKSATIAAQAGLSIEDLTAFIATLTRNGIKARQSMTAVNGVITKFLKPTKESANLARKLGFDMSTAALKSKGLVSIFKELQQFDPETVARLFPNIRGLTGVLTAMGDITGFAEDYEDALNAAGSTQIAFSKQSATVAFQMNKFSSGVERASIAIGKVFEKDVSAALKIGNKFLKFVTTWIKANSSLIKQFALLGIAASVIGTIIGAFGIGLTAFGAGIIFVTNFMLLLGSAVATIGGLVTTVATFLGGPIIAVIALIGAVAAGALFHFTDLSGKISSVIGNISDMGSSIIDKSKDFEFFGVKVGDVFRLISLQLERFGAHAQIHWNSFKKSAFIAGRGMVEFFGYVFNTIAKGAIKTGRTLFYGFNQSLTAIGRVGLSVAGFITDAFFFMVDTLKKALNQIIKAYNAAAGLINDDLKAKELDIEVRGDLNFFDKLKKESLKASQQAEFDINRPQEQPFAIFDTMSNTYSAMISSIDAENRRLMLGLVDTSRELSGVQRTIKDGLKTSDISDNISKGLGSVTDGIRQNFLNSMKTLKLKDPSLSTTTGLTDKISGSFSNLSASMLFGEQTQDDILSESNKQTRLLRKVVTNTQSIGGATYST